jgi:hypothetical protein
MHQETRVMHHDHPEAMLMNILIVMEMQLKNPEYLSSKQDRAIRARGASGMAATASGAVTRGVCMPCSSGRSCDDRVHNIC